MARNRIGRRIYRTYAHGTVVNSDNSLEDFDLELVGKLSIKTAQSRAQKILRTQRAVVTSITYDSVFASMSLEKFLSEADTILDHRNEKE